MGVRLTVLLAALLAPACIWTTKHDGDVMHKQIMNLDERVSAQEKVLEGRVKALDESIDKATKILARNSADLGTQVDKFSEELAQVSGKVEAAQRTIDAARNELAAVKQQQQDITTRLENIEHQLGISPGTGTGSTPTSMPTVDKNTLFDGALAKLQSGKFEDARREFRTFVQAFPQDDKADNAAYYVGESFYKEKDYDHAIAEFQRVIDVYPKGDMVDDAFLEAGQAAIDGKLCVEAGAYLGELVRRFPSSPLAKTAKDRIAYVKKNAKNKKICKD